MRKCSYLDRNYPNMEVSNSVDDSEGPVLLLPFSNSLILYPPSDSRASQSIQLGVLIPT